ncbi:hypothetical protein HPP92_026089 [Vanilla planifolia]|uniref:Uncharacterized protein n=1 Tax=Vanilla planifolia TaxID=51239 RepID=A0A835PDH8_VANPL|nr:hypothetical protein HPP92_026089 [Vanilla planifolia]
MEDSYIFFASGFAPSVEEGESVEAVEGRRAVDSDFVVAGGVDCFLLGVNREMFLFDLLGVTEVGGFGGSYPAVEPGQKRIESNH